jgi:hypothetical protein
MAQKKVTLESVAKSIDDLAAITAKGFESVHKDISEMRDELTEVKAEVVEINERLEKHYSPELENHSHRIKVLETPAGMTKAK